MSHLLERIGRWDRAIADKVTIPASSHWHWLPALGAHLGDGMLWAFIAAVLLLWGNAYLRGLALVAALAVLGATGISTILKYVLRRRRPQELSQFYALEHDRYSLPSGHATRTAAIATVVGHLVPGLSPIGYLLALLVGLCRILVGVHYPSDVLAGLLIGFVGARCVLLLL
jgi:undecaprenyl-diphosphatase